MRLKHLAGAIAFIVLLVAVGYAFRRHTDTPETPKTQEAPAMRFEIVTDEAAQERGLGGRAEIPANYGMLFVFKTADRYGFWMKDMLAPIDIIWLSDDGTILGIEDSVSPDTYPQEFFSPSPVRYVLETRAGEARARDWSVGTKVPLPYSQIKE